MEPIGERLRAARHAQGLSLRQAARRLGCSPRFLHELERGKPTARLDKVQQAAAGLGLRLSLEGGGGQSGAVAARAAARAAQRLREESLARAHERIAAKLAIGKAGPQALARARAQVAKWQEHGICSDWYVRRWNAILQGSPRRVAARLIDLEGPEARALFQNTPFGFLVRAELGA
jgi:transcriptional regulator with XRE-family HTH domain